MAAGTAVKPLTDDDVDKMSAPKLTAPQRPLTDDDVDKMSSPQPEQNPSATPDQVESFNKRLIGNFNPIQPITYAGKQYEKYVTGPTKGFISGLGQNKGIIESAKQGANEFGAETPNPEYSGKAQELRAQAERGEKDTSLGEVIPAVKGTPLDISKSGAWGAARDVVEDPLALFAAAGEGAKSLGTVAKESGASEALANAANTARNTFVKGGARVGEAFTGVPKGSVEHYINNYDNVENLIKKSGGSQTEAADMIREGYAKAIKQTRQGANSQITEALTNSDTPVAKTQDVLNSLDQAKSKLHPQYDADDIAAIDKIKNTIKRANMVEAPQDASLLDELKGGLNEQEHGDVLKQINELQGEQPKQFVLKDTMSSKDYYDALQHIRENLSYQKEGQFFVPGSKGEQALKGVSANMRKTLNAAEPSIADANNKLSQLHDLESKINKNLIKTERPYSALSSAGSGANEVNAGHLQRLEDITGAPITSQAKDFAAAGHFGEPSLLPVDTTGKAGARIGLGRSVGAGVGAAAGGLIDGYHGAALGAAGGGYLGGFMSSPAALKTAIRAGKISAEAVSKAAGLIGGLNKDADITKAWGLLRASGAVNAK